MRKVVLFLGAAFAVAMVVAASLAQPPAEQRGKRDDPRFGRGFPPSPLMDILDADRDGELSAEEIANAPQALKKLDRNGDRKLGREELRPMGMGPGGREGPGGPPMGFGGRAMGSAGFESSPMPKDDAERKILDVLNEMGQRRTPGGANVPREDGRILRVLAESIGAKNVVEIGTSTGHSGVWFCLALRQTHGKLTTFEIDAGRARQARENFQKAGVAEIVTLVEGDAHVEVAKLKDPIDLVFLDADKEGYLDYLEKLLPLVRPGGLIVAHNMNPQQADPRYLKAITANADLETVFLNMATSGIGVTLKKR